MSGIQQGGTDDGDQGVASPQPGERNGGQFDASPQAGLMDGEQHGADPRGSADGTADEPDHEVRSGRVKSSREDGEMSAELAPSMSADETKQANAADTADEDRSADAGRATGLFALAMAAASLFVWPLPLGLAAAVLGFYSYRQGSRMLGVWSITLGLIAALSYLVFIPILASLS